jgi:hypothetical protein
MVMLWALLVLLSVILIFGPLRRLYFRNAAYLVPATAGLIVGFVFGSYVMALAGVSWPYSFLIPAAMGAGAAAGLGERCKAWCDQSFSNKGGDHGRRGT